MHKLLLIILLTIACLTAKANPDSIMAYMRHAMLFNKFYPQEKVYLHFDNTGYFKGETIWFKAYVTRTDTRNRTDLSRVLYVELLNPSGDVIETRKLKIENGEAYGDIKLEQVLNSGFYEVRAYTRYMTNWGAEACFSRVFPIFNTPKNEGDYSTPTIDKLSHKKRLPNNREDKKPDDNGHKEKGSTATSAKSETNVRFFPEGGSLIKGLRSRVVFKISDLQNGIKCILADSNNCAIENLSVDSNGYGEFYFTPDGRTYYLRCGESSHSLPSARKEGCVVYFDMTGSDNNISVNISSTAGIKGDILGYVIANNGEVWHADTLTASDKPIRRLFQRDRIREGVNILTLFDSKGAILAERMFFICPTQKETDYNIRIRPNTSVFEPCKSIEFDIEAAPFSDMSLSVMDADNTVNGTSGDIMTWMLLSSELKGYIDNPEYYFEADDEEHRKAADLLMLTQGWRKYDWKQMSSGQSPNFTQPIEDQLYVYGNVRDKKRKTVADSISLNTFLFNRSGTSLTGQAITDSTGQYAFSIPDISGEWNMQIKATGADEDVQVLIDRHFSPPKRALFQKEAVLHDLTSSPFFLIEDTSNFADLTADTLSITEKSHLLPTVKIKNKRSFRGNMNRLTWYDEAFGASRASLFYNCQSACEEIADKGENIPELFEWFKEQNQFFSGSMLGDASLVNPAGEVGLYEEFNSKGELKRKSSTLEKESSLPPTYIHNPPRPWRKLYADGLAYKGRPIIWIVNNRYCTITNYRSRQFVTDTVSLQNAAFDLPLMLDEVKTAYVSEDENAYKQYVFSENLTGMSPVTVFLYTVPEEFFQDRKSLKDNAKGLRRTHFQGYNVPETFEMEDYSVLPPMDDFRRTIYWNPNISTGQDGKAQIKFYNNSTSKRLFVSAEGMAADGKFITSRKVKQESTIKHQALQEKVYLHFDNNCYFAGDTIWYKAYTVRADNNTPSEISKILYVELLNEQGFLVERQRLSLDDIGQAHGQFCLNDTTFAGYYEIRAYTRWMMNFGYEQKVYYKKNDFKGLEDSQLSDSIQKEFYHYGELTFKPSAWMYSARLHNNLFSRVIPVYERNGKGESHNRKVMPAKITMGDYSIIQPEEDLEVKFYPEGGNIVAGLPVRIAYEATNEHGMRINLDGKLAGDSAILFNHVHAGRGIMDFTPEPDKKYTALFTYKGKEYKFRLPEVMPEGCSLRALQKSDSLYAIINRKGLGNNHLLLSISSGGFISRTFNLDFNKNMSDTISAACGDLANGVVRLTVHDDANNIFADRLVFINNTDRQRNNLSISLSGQNVSPASKATLNLQLTNKLGLPVSGERISLAVRDAAQMDYSFASGNIMTELLLQSEVKGFIENPDFYFESNDSLHRCCLDLLMMVQGWRRYKWADTSRPDSFAPEFLPETNTSISGEVYNIESGEGTGLKKPVDVTFLLFDIKSLDDSLNIRGETVRTDRDGRFTFHYKPFYGYKTLNLKAKNDSLTANKKFDNFEHDWNLFIKQDYFYPQRVKELSWYETNQPDINQFVKLTHTGHKYDVYSQNYVLPEVKVRAKSRLHRKRNLTRPSYSIDFLDFINAEWDKGYYERFTKFTNVHCNLSDVFRGLDRLMGTDYKAWKGETTQICINGNVVNHRFEQRSKEGWSFIPALDRIDVITDNPIRKSRYKLRHYDTVSWRYGTFSLVPIGKYATFLNIVRYPEGNYRPFMQGRMINLQGFNRPAEFYSPDYSKMAMPKVKDYRKTLYWNPNVTTDKDGKATIEFYNNSVASELNISAEGITKDGKFIISGE